VSGKQQVVVELVAQVKTALLQGLAMVELARLVS
jgi:hypothetical protein